MSKVLRIDELWDYNEVVLFGIVSELPPIRLCFFLNEALSLKMVRSKKDRIRHYKDRKLHYTEFSYDSTQNGLYWRLLAHKNPRVIEEEESQIISGLPLISELKVMDYLLYYEGGPKDSIDHFINTQLKQLSYVRTFSKLDVSKVKNAETLLIG